MKIKHTFILLMILIVSCGPDFSQEKSSHILFEKSGYNFSYRLEAPEKSWKLPKSLVEISGLSYVDPHHLACVQDEKGIIYIFNRASGEIDSEILFGDDGDYEGIEIIGDDAWILKSSGTLYQVKDYREKQGFKTIKFKTDLTGKNDAEGLAYDPVGNSLLIACKGYPFLNADDGSGYKAVYSFNLENSLLDENPFLLISLDTIKFYRNYDAMTQLGMKTQAILNPSKGDPTFQPSGIAVHPRTGNIYMLGSVGKLLLVLSRAGEILSISELNPKLFPQPEGICFSPDGILYISNEGRGQEGTILEFEPDR